MAVRFTSALGWIFFIVAFFIILISYANFPNEVLLVVDSTGEPQLYADKDMIFYSVVAFLIIFNMALRPLRGGLSRSIESTELTQVGIGLTQLFTNMFLASSVYFVNILNSRENFNYSNFGYMIYLTGGLLLGAVIFTLVARLVLKK